MTGSATRAKQPPRSLSLGNYLNLQPNEWLCFLAKEMACLMKPLSADAPTKVQQSCKERLVRQKILLDLAGKTWAPEDAKVTIFANFFEIFFEQLKLLLLWIECL